MEETIWMLLKWYVLLMSVLGAALIAWDKWMAKKRGWRIPERVLLTVAAVGGAAGVLLGMLAARHKTKKARFVALVPLMLAVQVGLMVFAARVLFRV